MYTYLLINFFTILVPALLSFERRIYYRDKWKFVLPSMSIVGLIFIVWDNYFTIKGVWGFNPKYLVGHNFFGLPLEEILFFFCVPFSCIFMYEVVRYFQKDDIFRGIIKPFTNTLILALLFSGILNVSRIYTSTTSFLLAIFLAAHIYIIKSDYLGYFFQMYFISIIPFLIVNGILTNGLRFIDPGPVVWYNNAANLSIRILNIPVEDFLYSMLLLLCNITLYEYFKKR